VDQGGPTDILVVEDDPEMGEMLAELLRLQGYTVARARSCDAALDQLRESRTRLVLLDLPLTDMLAFRTTQLNDRRTADIPVVLLSAAENSSSIAADMHVRDWIVKPVDFGRLLRMISGWLRAGR
jgi:DNA-binding response OmpR family regulator